MAQFRHVAAHRSKAKPVAIAAFLGVSGPLPMKIPACDIIVTL
jgi:hypothetical protein